MKRLLLLLRHAEAQPVAPGQIDFDRPLTAHGRTQALAVAPRLHDAGLSPEALLASPSLRTRQTATLVAGQLQPVPAVSYDAELYPGAPASLLLALQRCDDAVQTLLAVGHNPGLSALAGRLARAQQPSRQAQPLELPTCGLCCVELDDCSWSKLGSALVRRVSLLR